LILNFDVLSFLKIRIKIIKMEKTRVTTPPSFEGIDRKIT